MATSLADDDSSFLPIFEAPSVAQTPLVWFVALHLLLSASNGRILHLFLSFVKLLDHSCTSEDCGRVVQTPGRVQTQAVAPVV